MSLGFQVVVDAADDDDGSAKKSSQSLPHSVLLEFAFCYCSDLWHHLTLSDRHHKVSDDVNEPGVADGDDETDEDTSDVVAEFDSS